jgi:hypothetical protein
MGLGIRHRGGNVTRSLVVGLIVGWCFVSPAFGQERPRSGVEQSGDGVKKASDGRKSSTSRGSKKAIEGRVIRLDQMAGILTTRVSGQIVTFDVSNPMFLGYRTLGDIRPGDSVAVAYTATGVSVARLSGKRAHSLVEEVAPKAEPPKTAKKLLKRNAGTNGDTFDDADVNKDGMVTPVELSVVIPDITMERFRHHDKNGSGRLDKSEFSEAIKQERAGGSR